MAQAILVGIACCVVLHFVEEENAVMGYWSPNVMNSFVANVDTLTVHQHARTMYYRVWRLCCSVMRTHWQCGRTCHSVGLQPLYHVDGVLGVVMHATCTMIQAEQILCPCMDIVVTAPFLELPQGVYRLPH